jgi:hypothetical protein
MREKEKGWMTYLLAYWAKFRLALRTDGNAVSVNHAIVLEWYVTQLQAKRERAIDRIDMATSPVAVDIIHLLLLDTRRATTPSQGNRWV